MSSLLKFANEQRDGAGNSVQWGRAEEDGLPFRGRAGMYKTESEYDARVSRICDFKFKRFHLDNSDDAAAYGVVMDKIANRWFRMFHIDRDGVKATPPWIYVEWGEYYMQECDVKKSVAAPQMATSPTEMFGEA